MRAYEWGVLVYFAYLAILALLRSIPARRRLAVVVGAAAASAAAAGVAGAAPWPAVALARDWILPLLYVLIGYWLSGQLFVRPMPRVEGWLHDVDRRLGIPPLAARVPRAVGEWLEAAYLSVYLVPLAGFAALHAGGAGVDAEAYWTVVVLPPLVCYGFLPWIQTRPPRAVEPPAATAAGPMRRLNLAVLERGSIQVNTVPSGHAAEALAVPLAMAAAGAPAAPLFFAAGAGIMGGAVLGRYHYAMDVASGALVAVAVWLAAG